MTAGDLIDQLRSVPADSHVFVAIGHVHSDSIDVRPYTEDDGQHTVWIGPPL